MAAEPVYKVEQPSVGEIVRNANRSDVHRRTGISLSGVSRILDGKRNASTDNLDMIAKVLGIDMQDLYYYLRTLRRRNKRRIIVRNVA